MPKKSPPSPRRALSSAARRKSPKSKLAGQAKVRAQGRDRQRRHRERLKSAGQTRVDLPLDSEILRQINFIRHCKRRNGRLPSLVRILADIADAYTRTEYAIFFDLEPIASKHWPKIRVYITNNVAAVLAQSPEPVRIGQQVYTQKEWANLSMEWAQIQRYLFQLGMRDLHQQISLLDALFLRR